MNSINRQQSADSKVWNGYTAVGVAALAGAGVLAGIGPTLLPVYSQASRALAVCAVAMSASYLWPAVKDGCKQLKEKITSLKKDLGTAPIALVANAVVTGVATAAGAVTLPVGAAIIAGGTAVGLLSAYLSADSTPARRAAPVQGQPNAAAAFEAQLFGAIAAPDEEILDCINEPGPAFQAQFVTRQRTFTSVKEAFQFDYDQVARSQRPDLWQARVKEHPTDPNEIVRDPAGIPYPTYLMIKILIAKFSQDDSALTKLLNMTDFSKFEHPFVKLPEVLEIIKTHFVKQLIQRARLNVAAQPAPERHVQWAPLPARAAAPLFNAGQANAAPVLNRRARKRLNNGQPLYGLFGQPANNGYAHLFNPQQAAFGQMPYAPAWQ